MILACRYISYTHRWRDIPRSIWINLAALRPGMFDCHHDDHRRRVTYQTRCINGCWTTAYITHKFESTSRTRSNWFRIRIHMSNLFTVETRPFPAKDKSRANVDMVNTTRLGVRLLVLSRSDHPRWRLSILTLDQISNGIILSDRTSREPLPSSYTKRGRTWRSSRSARGLPISRATVRIIFPINKL